MSFRDKFLLISGKPFDNESSNLMAKMTESRFRARLELQRAQMKLLQAGFEHVAQTQVTASEALQGELIYQAEQLGRQIAQSSSDMIAANKQNSAEIIDSIQQMSDYLGAGLSEIRWAVERHTAVSEEILQILIESRSHESRQFFEQGVKCYEASEYELAKKAFNKALEDDVTNHFAYQYLGYIAVAEDNSTEAIRNFDLARKFAETAYHRALAISHLARSHQAIEELEKAADWAQRATETHPVLAKFWYEFAGYSARLGRSEQAIVSLKEAIERDWVYWVVVVGDKDFDSIRTDVTKLLDTLREREKQKAQEAIDNLSLAIETAKRTNTREIASFIKFLDDYRKQFRLDNIYIYRELIPQAQKQHETIFQIIEKLLQEQIRNKEKVISDNQAQKNRAIKDLELPLNDLRKTEGNITSSDVSDFGCFGCGCLGIFGIYLVTLIIFSGPLSKLILDHFTQEDTKTICELIALSTFFMPPILTLIIWLYTVLDSTQFKKEIAIKIIAKEREIEALKKKIERESEHTQKTLITELNELKGMLEKCKKRQYL